MSEHRWSAQVARVMHELADAAPPPPTSARVDECLDSPTPPEPRRRTRMLLTIAVVVAFVALVAGFALTRGETHHARTSPMTPGPDTGGDAGSVSSAAPVASGAASNPPASSAAVGDERISVVHARVEVRLTGELTCPTPIGTPETVVADTYSDRVGRRWRTTYTYPDGAVGDVVAIGSAIYPNTLAQRGTARDVRLGCPQPDQPAVTLVAFGDEGLYSLNMPAELAADEQAYYDNYTTRATRTSTEATDSRGRQTELWTWQVNGTTDVDGGRPIAQTTRWWVDPTTGTVTQQEFATSITGLGTATRTDTLTTIETTAVPADFFDTAGYTPLTPLPRPPAPPGTTTSFSTPPATTASTASTDTASTLQVTSTTAAPSLDSAGRCSRWDSPRPDRPPGTFGVALPASVLSCFPPNFAGTIARGTTALWVTEQRGDGNIAVRLDASLTPTVTIPLPDYPTAMAADRTALWAITSHGGGAPVHVVRVDIARATVTLDVPIAGTSIPDGPVPPMSISIAGNDVWLTVDNGPDQLTHYRSDGTLDATIPLAAPPVAVAATERHVFVLAATGELDAVDPTTTAVTRLATLPPATEGLGTLAANSTDVWADTTELVHIDPTTGTVTDRRPALINQLAIDPSTGRVWAARYEPDPTVYPGAGTGSVVRIADHGIQPDGALYFETLMSNGISQLAFTDDGAIYGENSYTGELVRIEVHPS